VKIVRPQVRERLAADFEGVSLVARLGDLLLGEKVVRSFVSHSLEETVHRLRCAVLSEADMSNERGNLEAFRQWLALSTTLRRANLSECIYVPKTFAQASSKRVLTMECIDGKPLSEIWQEDSHEATMDMWQSALVKALTVAAMSVIDDEGIFHADLHSGNIIMMDCPNGDSKVAFIDFGCCGRLPRALQTTLLMQGSAFAGNTPDIRQFTRGFAYALSRIPGLGPESLDTEALEKSLAPLIMEVAQKDFTRDIDVMDSELHFLVLRLQATLFNHGIQLPSEFTLLIKTGCFGSLYLSKLDRPHRMQLLSQLISAAAAYASCHLGVARQVLSATVLTELTKRVAKADNLSLLWEVLAQRLPMPCHKRRTSIRCA